MERPSVSIGKSNKVLKNIFENKSVLLTRNCVKPESKDNEIENNSNLINFNQTMIRND